MDGVGSVFLHPGYRFTAPPLPRLALENHGTSRMPSRRARLPLYSWAFLVNAFRTIGSELALLGFHPEPFAAMSSRVRPELAPFIPQGRVTWIKSRGFPGARRCAFGSRQEGEIAVSPERSGFGQ